VAWSKPKGENLREYVTQRFASNMIVLSLMLGAEIGVFFNSAAEVTEMRTLLNAKHYGSIKYWIGIIIALDASVTVMAIIATFTREYRDIFECWIVCFYYMRLTAFSST
jgi:NAD/NADP transhydrogenase beta subunit